jgi:hypothetical protein
MIEAEVCTALLCRLQGANLWNFLPSIKGKPYILFGCDVAHPTSYDPNEPSVAAVVASMNPPMTRQAAFVPASQTQCAASLLRSSATLYLRAPLCHLLTSLNGARSAFGCTQQTSDSKKFTFGSITWLTKMSGCTNLVAAYYHRVG